MGKEELIRGVTGTDTVTWARNDGMKVHLYGSTGVVTGILAMKGRGASGPFDKRYRFTDTWKLIDGRWQIIAAQDYLIPK
jgi:ketosteroid isomerase-like protein